MRRIGLFLALPAVLVLAGCALLGTGPDVADARAAFDDGRYEETRRILAGLLADEREELIADRLLGAALVLDALAAWKTGDHAAALSRVAEAEAAPDLGPRDAVMAAALPGILVVEEALAALEDVGADGGPTPEAAFAEWRPKVEGDGPDAGAGALAILERARRRAEAEGHEVEVVVIEHELHAFETVMKLYFLAGESLRPYWAGRARVLADRLGGLAGDDRRVHWYSRLAL